MNQKGLEMRGKQSSKDLTLRQEAELLMKGKKLTRSAARQANAEPMQSIRHAPHRESLLPFNGEPELQQYLGSSNITNYSSWAGHYIQNKNMRRLHKYHLPQYCTLYENVLRDNVLEMRQVHLIPKKAKYSEYLVQMNSSAAVQCITNESGYLMATQTLAFYLMDKVQFQRIFSKQLAQLEIEHQQYLITRRIEVVAPPPIQIPIEIEVDIPELTEIPQNVSVPQVEQEIIPQIHKLTAGDVAASIFNRLAFADESNLHHPVIAWPAIVMQPLNTDRDSFKRALPAKTVERDCECVLRKIYKQILAGKEEEQRFFSRQLSVRINRVATQEEASTINYGNYERRERDNDLFLQLIQTSHTVFTEKGVLRWSEFSYEQACELVRTFNLEELNLIITALNKFKSLENAPFRADEQTYFFNRLCKFKSHSSFPHELCIPIRHDQSKDEKRVLVRFLRDEGSGMESQPGRQLSLKWIALDRVSANYTLPKANSQQTQFYYLVDKCISVAEMLNYIYADYYYEAVSFLKTIEKYYPGRRESDSNRQRCIYCNFSMHDLPFFRCMFCGRHCHQECVIKQRVGKGVGRRGGKGGWKQFEGGKQLGGGGKELEGGQGSWNCAECEACSQCYQAVEQNYLRCEICLQLFHEICGKLKGSSEQLSQNDKFTCQSCLKCKICTIRLRNQEYCIQEREIFCIKCYRNYKNNDYCIICMKEMPGKWVQCGKEHCKKWVHLSCDTLSSKDIERVKYWCPPCRLIQRRKIAYRVIDQLKPFDDYRYFHDAHYEELLDYGEIVQEPMCLAKMKESAIEGEYDRQGFEKISSNFELIISNALSYNMPKEVAHYKAKMFNIFGKLALSYFREIMDCSEEELVNRDLVQWFHLRKRELYLQIHQHFLEIVLNYQSERARIIVKKSNPTPLSEELIYNPRYILNNIFVDPEISFIMKKSPQQISNLFANSKLEHAHWLPVRGNRCYYHSKSARPITFSCDLCCESYCCISVCYRHRECGCGTKGCNCQFPQCGCPPLRVKDRKALQGKIKAALPNMQKTEYTQNYKYCLKCVCDRLKRNQCAICKQFAVFDYQICRDCEKCFHVDCEIYAKNQQYASLFPNEQLQSPKLANLCRECSFKPIHEEALRQMLARSIKLKMMRLHRVSQYEEVMKYIYRLKGVKVSTGKLTQVLLSNYQQFEERFDFLDELGSNMREVNCISQYLTAVKMKCSVEISELLREIASTHNQVNRYAFKRVRGGTVPVQHLVIQSQQWLWLMEYQLRPFINEQTFEEIHEETVEKSRQLFKERFKRSEDIDLHQQIFYSLISSEKDKRKQGKFVDEFVNEFVDEFVDEQKCILIGRHCMFDPFRGEFIPEDMRVFRGTNSGHVVRRTEQIIEVLSRFALSIFEDDKMILRRGSTCILRESPWRVLKKWGNKCIQIRLENAGSHWRLTVGNNAYFVSSVEDVIQKVRTVCPVVSNFQELSSFLGFTFGDFTFYQSCHFTDLLQTSPLDGKSKGERKKIVQGVYDRFTWDKQGVWHQFVMEDGGLKKYEYNVTKTQVFYLQKRSKQKETTEPVTTAYITFEDLKKDLDGLHSSLSKPDTFIFKDPTNDVYIAPSKIHKLGLFITKDTRKNTIVVQYIGETICEALADLRESKYHFGCYMFGLNRRNIDRRDIIDATFRGNMARYLNHSCDPNCKASVQMVDGCPRIFIYTIRDVKSNEELTYDYQFKVDTNEKLVCMCKAKNCQGRLN